MRLKKSILRTIVISFAIILLGVLNNGFNMNVDVNILKIVH